ncbi:MAG: GNAT family N-acetyltransferase [Pseudomonadota bacterium]|nr:GNAT family N-acetyltransferase [Pseudomonadota bacterium]
MLLSFAYKILGFSTGLHEGVLLGSAEACPVPMLKEFAGDIGASLLKITRTAAEPAVPGQVRTERGRLWTVVHRATRARELLPLGACYDSTLASFGRHTRRNVRNVRKIAFDAGLSFEASTGPPLISKSERAALARQTPPNGVCVSLTRRLEAYGDRTGQPFRSVIRAPHGEIVSYAWGYLGTPAAAYLLYQLNNPAFNALSPSLLNRAHLIEWLIGRGCTEFVFVHGCTGVVQHACVRQPLEEVFLMRRSAAAYLAASPIAFMKAESSLGRLVRAAVFAA